MNAHTFSGWDALQPGDHLCCLYESEEEYLAILIPFVLQGLERGERIFYIVDAHTVARVQDYLAASGVAVAALVAAGQLCFETSDATYMQGGTFSPSGMIDLLAAETERALAAGYKALRVTGEMTWALRGLPGSERLIEYEALLNTFISTHRCIALCQYDRRRFAPRLLLEVLTTHPIAVIGTEWYENFYYLPPADLLGPEPERARLEQWIANLAAYKRNRAQLHDSQLRWEWVLGTVVDGVVLVDRQGQITYANPAAEQILELQRDWILQRTYDDPDWRPIDRTGRPFPVEQLPLTIALRECREAVAVEHGLLFPSGKSKWLSVNAAPLITSHGELYGAIATFRDITAQYEAEAARQARLEQELATLEQILSSRHTAITAHFFGQAPLEEQLPELFARLCSRYAALLDLALEQQIFKTTASLSQELQQLAATLGQLRVGPRDVIEIHTGALKIRLSQIPPLKAQKYTAESRLVLIELLGYLVAFYRAQSLGLSAGQS